MIGIVVVSHSHALAVAAAALAQEMVEGGSGPRVEVAAGLDEQTFGTDAAAVAEAVGRADSGDGVLVLLDLGSAVLSAEMALEFLDPDLAGRVRVSPAPLVEGLVAAVVTAAAGGDLAAVAGEAERGLVGKEDHLGGTAGTAAPVTGVAGAAGPAAGPPAGSTVTIEVLAPHGLHARPAARFVAAVNARRGVEVAVRNLDTDKGPVDGRSLTSVATLSARRGHRIEVTATGDGAADLVADLQRLGETGFGDLDPPVGPVGASPGGADAAADTAAHRAAEVAVIPPPALVLTVEAALGPAIRRPSRRLEVSLAAYRTAGPEAEKERLEAAVAAARHELTLVAAQARATVGAAEAGIFEAHLALLDDPALRDSVDAAVASGVPAPEAWRDRIIALRADFDQLDDDYQRERAQDVVSVGLRVLGALLAAQDGDGSGLQGGPDLQGGPNLRGDGLAGLDGATGRRGILVVDELDPGVAVTLDPTTVAGVVTLRGGATGHGVLVARARGIPVVTGAGERADVAPGTMLGLLVPQGRVVVEPGAIEVAEIEAQIAQSRGRAEQARAHAHEPARTLDGHTVLVKANVGTVTDAVQASAAGADGSGLVRTEVLFGGYRVPPSVTEQVHAFTAIAEAMQGRPVTIRTWDIGGDKPLPFHPQPAEANPFLGVRGLRSFREDPTLLVDQLEAVCQVAARHPVRVMFPMVATVEEVDWALARLDEAASRLPGEPPATPEVGIMVEVPAAALRAEALSVQLDFVSIGSNDLTQYVLAAERGSALLGGLDDAADPAVLELVRLTATGVADGVGVSLCGDAASDPLLAGLLVGLGVHELSATAASVALVKAHLRRHTLTDLQDLAERALRCDSAAEVRQLLLQDSGRVR